MATFNYVRLGSRVGVIQNGRTNRRWFSPEDIKPVKDTERSVMILEALNNGSYSATINPATDTVVLDGTTIAAGGTLDALETALVGSSVFLKPSSGGGGGSALIPNNSTVVYFGDSITGQGYASAGVINSFASNGFVNWLNLFTGQKLYMPLGGNLGVSGNSTSQMVARLGAALALKPAIVTFMGGTNDPATLTSAQSIANFKTIINAFLSINAKVVWFNVTPRFSPNALSAPNQIKVDEMNAFINSYSNPNVMVVNANPSVNTTGNYTDGLHPNQTGAYNIGLEGYNKISSWFNTNTSMIASLLQDNTFTTNIALAGTAGTKNTATGNVADSWALLANNAGGATVVGSKTTDEGFNQQVVTLSGNYTGTGRNIQMYLDFTGTQPTNGQTIEGFAEVEIISPLTNVVGIYMQVQSYTAGYASTLANAYSILPPANETLNFPAISGRFILRTPPALIGGTSAIISNVLNIELKTVGVSTPVSGVIKIHKIGVRRLL